MSNKAAWLKAKQAVPVEVGDAPFPQAGPDEVVIKNHVAAVNPVDWKIQYGGYFITKYPTVLGTDVAGEIYEVGSNVKDFKKGDRVIGHVLSLITQDPKHGAFQYFSAAPVALTAKIPDDLSYENASVLPLAISTASAGLYQKNHLKLPFPSTSPEPSGKVILVWGGSSSVGATAVQLAVASGVKVISTASSRNHQFVQDLGASEVFDHSSSSVVDDVVKAIRANGSSTFAGAYDAISVPESQKIIGDIVEKLGGGKLASVLPPTEGLPGGVITSGIIAPTIKDDEVGPAVWGRYVPEALATGNLKPQPPPLVFKGLEQTQAAMEKNKEGVSAAKVVIKLI